MKTPHLFPSLVVIVTALAHTSAFAGLAEDTAATIRAEAARPNMAADGRPLPLWSTWGLNGATQIQLVEQGHFAIPMFFHSINAAMNDPAAFHENYEKPLQRARELGLPVGFISIGGRISASDTLLKHPPFSELPPEKSGLAYDDQGQLIKTPDGASLTSPFGAVEAWRELGRFRADDRVMRRVQELYPDPPLVILLSNNEEARLNWQDSGKDFRCPPKARNTKDGDLKRQVTGDGWIERFRALHGAWKAGLTEPWQKAVRFIAYEASASVDMGRSWGWENYSLHSKGRVSPWPLVWDGASPSFYSMHGSHGRMPDGLWSPMVKFQGFHYLVPAMHRLNPDFWHEMSIWDGVMAESIDASGKDSRERFYAAAGLTYTPQHFAGFTQFGLWLSPPRIARDFLPGNRPQFVQAVGESVSRVHRDPALREWWRKGELVPNKSREHPYGSGFPKEFEKEDRWFILDTNLDPPTPWTHGHDDPGATTSKFTRLPVFAIALTRGGGGGARQWLVYTFAPMTERKGVKIKIPGYGRRITVDVPVQGAFYEVDERSGNVKLLPPPENLPMLQSPGTTTLARATTQPAGTPAAPPVVAPTTPAPTALPATADAKRDAVAFGSRRFKLFTEHLDWRAAKEKCAALNGRLAGVRSKEENDFILSLAQGKGVDGVWLGGTDEAQERRWLWSDGSPLTYSNWDKGQPNNFGAGGENYLMMLVTGNPGKWAPGVWWDQPDQAGRGLNPGFKAGYVCEWDDGGAPAAVAPSSSVAMPAAATPEAPADPQLAALHAAWTARFDAEATKPFETAIAALNTSYTAALARARTAAKNNGALNEVLAIDAELQQIQTSAAPGADAADTPPTLTTLRKTWHDTTAKHAAARDAKLAQLRAQYVKALDALIIDLTKANKIEEAKRAQQFRDGMGGK